MVVGLLPPTKIADTKTPSGLSHSSASTGHCDVETVNLQFGCAAGDPFSGVQSSFFQSIKCSGVGPSMPSHHTSKSSVNATFVNIVFLRIDIMAFGLDS